MACPSRPHHPHKLGSPPKPTPAKPRQRRAHADSEDPSRPQPPPTTMAPATPRRRRRGGTAPAGEPRYLRPPRAGREPPRPPLPGLRLAGLAGDWDFRTNSGPKPTNLAPIFITKPAHPYAWSGSDNCSPGHDPDIDAESTVTAIDDALFSVDNHRSHKWRQQQGTTGHTRETDAPDCTSSTNCYLQERPQNSGLPSTLARGGLWSSFRRRANHRRQQRHVDRRLRIFGRRFPSFIYSRDERTHPDLRCNRVREQHEPCDLEHNFLRFHDRTR